MNPKLDDLFSPERLRKNWQRSEETVKGQGTTEEQTPLHIFAYLKDLIEKRFQGDNAATLNIFLETLKTLLVRRFPEAEQVEEDQDALDTEIHDVLNKIEDLVEAFEIGRLNR